MHITEQDLSKLHMKEVLLIDQQIGLIYEFISEIGNFYCFCSNESYNASTLHSIEKSNLRLRLKFPDKIKQRFKYGKWVFSLDIVSIENKDVIYI